MDHTTVTGTRTTLLGVLVIAALVALYAGDALTPSGVGETVSNTRTALGVVDAVAAHPAQTYVAGLLLVLGVLGLGVAFVAFARLIRADGARLATASGVVGAFAAISAAAIKLWVLLDVFAATQADIPRTDAARIVASTQHGSGVDLVFTLGYDAGPLLAAPLLGVALWRSRVVPRWVGPGFVAGLLALAASPSGPTSLLLGLPFLVTTIYLALQLVRGERPVSDEIGVRRRILAGVTLLGLALFLAGTDLTPPGGDTQVMSTHQGLEALAVVRTHLGMLYLSGLLTILGMMAMAAALPTIASTIRERGHRWATAAGALGALGMASSALFNIRVYLDMYAVAQAGVTPSSGAAYLMTTQHSSLASIFPALGEFLVLPVSFVVMAVALWRSRTEPRWLAVLLPASLLMGLALGNGTHRLADTLADLPFAVVVGYLVTQSARSGRTGPGRTGRCGADGRRDLAGRPGNLTGS